ncbi:TetR/AcrR family transcriptional regulator C-terminal domain-containing protein [Actinomadura vinacea]|uniref:TetR/AcrR family transcriptional regulator C-terminal domain-containing protein n=1 Tax=Actinomadura vinacea TaxID=115336 RepID=A0ABN3IHS8_9ACTN
MSPKRAEQSPSGPGAVWLRERRQGTRTPALSIERITAAAVRILDEDGQSGLSMRKLADALGVHATSLYWHVANRDDLLDLALDAVFGEVEAPRKDPGLWQADIAAYMTGLREALLRHPWAGALASARPLMGPHALDHAESVQAALVRAGFSGTALTAAAAAISNYVIGSVAAEASWGRHDQSTARRALTDHVQSAALRYPTLAAHPPTPYSDWQTHFEHGMRFLIAGLTASAGTSG